MNSYDDILTENSGQSKAFSAEQKQEWAAQRDSERDYVFGLIRDATEQMTAGNGNLQTYLDVQSRFDKYSVANAILIAVQRPDATKLDDGQGWNEKGVRIRKGETGMYLLAPGKEFTKRDGTPGVSYNVKKQFDISQTNAKQEPLPEVSTDPRLLLKSLIRDAPCEIVVDEAQCGKSNALYNAEKQTIFVRPGMEFPILFRSLTQEIAVAHLSKGGMPREKNFFIAYCASYMLCRRNNIAVDGFRFDRVPDYFSQLGEKEVKEQLSKMRDTANAISSGMSKVLEAAKASKPPDRDSR